MGCRSKCYNIGGILLVLLGLGALIYFIGFKFGVAVFAAICVFAAAGKWVFIPCYLNKSNENRVSRPNLNLPYDVRVSRPSSGGTGRLTSCHSVVEVKVPKRIAPTPRNACTYPKVIVSESDEENHSDKVAFIVATGMKCSLYKAQTLIQLMKDGATIPFLIRYRKNVVGDWSPKDMRNFKDLYQNAKNVVARAVYVKRNIDASGRLNEHVTKAIDNARTVAELDNIFELYKPAKIKPILGDQEVHVVADQILNQQFVDIRNFVKPTRTLEDVKALLSASITEEILRRMCDISWKGDDWTIRSVKIPNGKVDDDKENFKKYYDFQQPISRHLRADEVLAMNRGAKKNILKVTLTPGNNLKMEIQKTMNQMLGLKSTHLQKDISDVLEQAKTAAQNKLIAKLSKKAHKNITRSAQDTAIEVFSSNLKRLLLTPPFRSDHELYVMGIDPGMRHGCKTVVVDSKSLTAMHYSIIHLFPFKGPRDYPRGFERILKEILKKWNVEIIVVGNGVGCQEVEQVVNNIIKIQEFSGVRYMVIPENGVSVYSVSEEAEQEYPGFTPELISSLSLVKRFFSPLHEYVKVDPKHLGIGMYQHDIDEQKLNGALQETISEIVSIVGVNLNTASLPLLKSISGLTASRARAIIAHRKRRGAFKNRNELLEVEGIDDSVFQQCAGFVRIIPPSNGANRYEYNPLDQTIIHPEHYCLTHKLLGLTGLSINNIGKPEFIERVNDCTSREVFDKLSVTLSIDDDTIELLLHALSMSLNPDIRTLAEPPELKTRLCTFDELHVGGIVSGRVENVTTFGAFVDIGVGVSGLLPFRDHNKPDIGLGDKIEAKIDKLEVNRKRIGLKLIRKVSDLIPMKNLI